MGAVLAVAFYKAVRPEEFRKGTEDHQQQQILAPDTPKHGDVPKLLSEMLGTYFLVIVAGAYGAGEVSGGCFNPAVALGIDASSYRLGFGWCVTYMLFEFFGAVLAVAFY